MIDPAALTLADIAPWVDQTTALGIEIAVQRRRADLAELELAALRQQLAEPTENPDEA